MVWGLPYASEPPSGWFCLRVLSGAPTSLHTLLLSLMCLSHHPHPNVVPKEQSLARLESLLSESPCQESPGTCGHLRHLNFFLCMQQRTRYCSKTPTLIFYFFPKESRSIISNMSKHLDSQAEHWHSGTSQPLIPMLSPGCHIFCFSNKYCHLHKCYSTHNRPPGRLQTIN